MKAVQCYELFVGISLKLSIPLCSIYQQGIECNVIPEEWKLADVTPLFKKGSRSQFSSYRPISLSSLCCKVLVYYNNNNNNNNNNNGYF